MAAGAKHPMESNNWWPIFPNKGDYLILTLIQLCGVRTDPAVTKIVTLLEWKVIDKSPLA